MASSLLCTSRSVRTCVFIGLPLFVAHCKGSDPGGDGSGGSDHGGESAGGSSTQGGSGGNAGDAGTGDGGGGSSSAGNGSGGTGGAAGEGGSNAAGNGGSGGTANGGSGGAPGAPSCGDTSSVAAFFGTRKDVDIVYDAGGEGPNGNASTTPYKMMVNTGGLGDILVVSERTGTTVATFQYSAADDTFEDLPLELNVTFNDTIGYQALLQCTKATGAWTLVLTAVSDPLIWTRWLSE